MFNYFTTKESMFFDRTGPMNDAVADAVRERGSASLIEVVVGSIASEIHPGRLEALDDATQLQLIRRFPHAATGSPTLVAARFADLPRFIDKVSVALEQRIGAYPLDPAVQLATFVIAGLVEVPRAVCLSPRRSRDVIRRPERCHSPRLRQSRSTRRAVPDRIRQYARNGTRLRGATFGAAGGRAPPTPHSQVLLARFTTRESNDPHCVAHRPRIHWVGRVNFQLDRGFIITGWAAS